MRSRPQSQLKQDLLSQTRTTEKQLRDVFAGLMAYKREHPKRQARRSSRHYFTQISPVTVSVEHMTDRREMIAIPVDLSESGIGLIMPSFVHPGSKLQVALTTFDNETVIMPGTAVWCLLVSMPFHELGARFNHPVDPSMFIELSDGAIRDKGESTTGDVKAKLANSLDPYDRMELLCMDLAEKVRQRIDSDKIFEAIRELDKLSKELEI